MLLPLLLSSGCGWGCISVPAAAGSGMAAPPAMYSSTTLLSKCTAPPPADATVAAGACAVVPSEVVVCTPSQVVSAALAEGAAAAAVAVALRCAAVRHSCNASRAEGGSRLQMGDRSRQFSCSVIRNQEHSGRLTSISPSKAVTHARRHLLQLATKSQKRLHARNSVVYGTHATH